MQKHTPQITFTSHKGFFYRTSRRRELGLGWALNPSLPVSVRECEHAIGIDKEVIENMREGEKILGRIYQPNKSEGRMIFKGTYSIDKKRIKEWLGVVGYYEQRGGKKVLVIPNVLWDVVEMGESPLKPPQMRLNLWSP